MSIGKKIYISVIIAILIGLVVVGVNYIYSINDMKTKVYTSQEKTLRTVFKEAIYLKENIGLTNAINMAKKL